MYITSIIRLDFDNSYLDIKLANLPSHLKIHWGLNVIIMK